MNLKIICILNKKTLFFLLKNHQKQKKHPYLLPNSICLKIRGTYLLLNSINLMIMGVY